jgi:hypothetical protein
MLPVPRAPMKSADQLAETWKTCLASAGPSTRIGSAATVTEATISSKMMILGFPGPGFSWHRYSLRAF